ncbi:YecA family protein [Aurantivibrio plasticivorans]
MTNKTQTLPSFDGLADQFLSLGALNSPAELHGMICGHLCGGGRYSHGEWLKAAKEFLDCSQSVDGESEQLLIQIYQTTLSQLRDQEFSVLLLLPDDDTDLEQRIVSLGHWCHGFLTGFGTSGLSGDTQMSAETADALRDFAAFVQISPEDALDDDSENDYMEIVEYIRVALLTIFMEIGVHSDPNPEEDQRTVH